MQRVLQDTRNPESTHFGQQPLTIRTSRRDRFIASAPPPTGMGKGLRKRSEWGCNLRFTLITGQRLTAGTLQGLRKGLHTWETVERVFRQRSQDHRLHGNRQLWLEVAQWRRSL